jgi:hypothetical protein
MIWKTANAVVGSGTSAQTKSILAICSHSLARSSYIFAIFGMMSDGKTTKAPQFSIAIPGPDRDGVARLFFSGFQFFRSGVRVVVWGGKALLLGSRA